MSELRGTFECPICGRGYIHDSEFHDEDMDDVRRMAHWLEIRGAERLKARILGLLDGYKEATVDKTTSTESELTSLRAEVEKIRKDRDSWKSHWQMYRDAWVRELGGWLLPKSHEIDALVLTTRARCVKIILGNCSTPHWLGKPTADGKGLQQTPHPNESACREWRANDPESAECLKSRIGELEAALCRLLDVLVEPSQGSSHEYYEAHTQAAALLRGETK